ncbi:MAG: helix-turn-helix domain-containing protein, partial [Acidimicrobiia bacterium]
MDRSERARVYASLGDEHRLEIVERLLVTDLTPTEIGRQVDLPSNLLAHHLDVLESAGVIDRRVSDGDARRRYVRVITDTLPDELRPHTELPDRVLFACRHNSARSQLAAALFEERTGRTALSAGSQPARAIHSKARAAGAEAGLRLVGAPKGYEAVEAPDLVVSVCDIAGEEPPPFAAPRLHWSVPDPVTDGRMRAFRSVRDE